MAAPGSNCLAFAAGYRGDALQPGSPAGLWALKRAHVRGELRLRLRGDGGAADRTDALAFLAALAALQREGLAAFGYLGFEVGAALERIATASAPIAAGQPRRGAFDRLDTAAFVTFDPADLRAVDDIFELAAAPPATAVRAADRWSARQAGAGPGFCIDVAAGLERIGEGRIYQVNLSRALPLPRSWARAARRVDVVGAAAALVAAQPVSHAAVLELPCTGGLSGRGPRLLCASMERFLDLEPAPDAASHRRHVGAACHPPAAGVDAPLIVASAPLPLASAADRRVRSRPIKGTRPRAADGAADAGARQALLSSSKERAENAMIVDMVRHDLGRVARLDGVRVSALFEAVPYRTLWHLESEVEAALRPDVDLAALLAATLPPASVSGAPKVAAVQQIVALEGRRRGPYCGAIGALWPDGSAHLAVGIRLAVVDTEGGELAVGAGIVADSTPAAEWAELLTKARGMALALAGLSRGGGGAGDAAAPEGGA